MHVLARPAINRFKAMHPEAGSWLDSWWEVASKSRWTSLASVRETYASADQVGCCLVLNGGNDYRLIVRVTYANEYTQGTILVKEFLTHAEYDENKWKKHCT